MLRASTINRTMKASTFSVERANKISVLLAEPGANHCSVLKACNTNKEAESRSVATAKTMTRVRRALVRGDLIGSGEFVIAIARRNLNTDRECERVVTEFLTYQQTFDMLIKYE